MTLKEQYNKILKEIEEVETSDEDPEGYDEILKAKLQTFKERCEDELKFLEELQQIYDKKFEEFEPLIKIGAMPELEKAKEMHEFKKVKDRISDLKEVLK